MGIKLKKTEKVELIYIVSGDVEENYLFSALLETLPPPRACALPENIPLEVSS